MEIAYPAATTYWIISSGDIAAAGQTEPMQVTTVGEGREVLLQTTNEAEWRAECERLGIGDKPDADELNLP
jgi:hypothetical protein